MGLKITFLIIKQNNNMVELIYNKKELKLKEFL